MREELLSLLKALADQNRLKILGLLAQGERSVEELATLLNVRPPTVSHHLSKMARVGLVRARAQGYYNFYQLDRAPLQRLGKLLQKSGSLPVLASDVDSSTYRETLLARFCDARGRFAAVPRPDQRQAQAFALLLRDLAMDKSYVESELDEILARMTDDPADARQKLVERGWLVRRGNKYRRRRTG